MPQHVDMHRKRQPGSIASPLDHASNAHPREGLAALIDKHIGALNSGSELNADCYDDVPRMPSARLQLIEGRLDGTWVAVQTIQVAVAQFQKQLSDQQRARFNALQLAATP